MYHSHRRHTTMLTLLSGILFGMANLVPAFWWLSIPALALLALLVETAARRRSAVFIAVSIGIIKMLLVMSWALTIYPVDWFTDAPHSLQLAALMFCWIGTSVTIGAGFGLFGALRLVKGRSWVIRALVFAILLVASENFGALLFSIFSYGPGSTLNTNFGFGMTGFSMVDHGLLRIVTPYGGVYILGIMAGLFAYGLRVLLATNIYYAALFVCIFVGTGYLHAPRAPLPPIRVAAIGTSFPSFRTQTYADMRNDQRLTHEAVHTALSAGAEMVVLTEDQRFGYAIDSNTLYRELGSTTHAKNAVVVDSYRTDTGAESVVLRAYVYDIDAQKTYTQDKKFLVPIGEYVPSLFSMILGTLQGNAAFNPMKYTIGAVQIPQDAPARIPSILFCFENIAGLFAKDAVGTRAPLLMVHPVSHSWFHYHAVLDNEERQTLMVQALFTGVPILQAGNAAPNVLYAKDGTSYRGTTYTKTDRYTITLFDAH
jgi:apolipoprotein N-acyltransferase